MRKPRRTRVDQGYASEISAFHREIWDRVRPNAPDDRAKSDSLDRLLVQGYCYTEIAIMFGLSRERVRQWCAKYGLSGPGRTHFRVWDDDLNRFRPVRPREYDKKLNHARRDIEGQAREEERRKKRLEQVAVVRDLGEELGRVPSLGEVGSRLGLSVPGLAYYWGHRNDDSNGITYSDCTARLYARAGLDVRPLGTPGHLPGAGRRRRVLSDADVAEIREDYRDGATQRVIASRHGVSHNTIFAAIHGTGAYAAQ